MLTADLEEERVAEVLPVPGPGLHKDTIRLAIKVLYHLLGLANLGQNVYILSKLGRVNVTVNGGCVSFMCFIMD